MSEEQKFEFIDIPSDAAAAELLESRREQQNGSVNITGGTFTVTSNGQTTPPLPHDLPPELVQREIDKLDAPSKRRRVKHGL